MSAPDNDIVDEGKMGEWDGGCVRSPLLDSPYLVAASTAAAIKTRSCFDVARKNRLYVPLKFRKKLSIFNRVYKRKEVREIF